MRTEGQCLHRWTKVLKPGLVKGPWTKDEDVVVIDMVNRHGIGNVKWSVIASKLPGRVGKQCRERWFNHLDPTIKKGAWDVEEDRVIYEVRAFHFVCASRVSGLPSASVVLVPDAPEPKAPGQQVVRNCQTAAWTHRKRGEKPVEQQRSQAVVQAVWAAGRRGRRRRQWQR